MRRRSATTRIAARGRRNRAAIIARYSDEDLEAVARIFTDAVHELAVGHYDEAQREAWAPKIPDMAFWRERMAEVAALVAEADGEPLGFVAFDGFVVEDTEHVERNGAVLHRFAMRKCLSP